MRVFDMSLSDELWQDVLRFASKSEEMAKATAAYSRAFDEFERVRKVLNETQSRRDEIKSMMASSLRKMHADDAAVVYLRVVRQYDSVSHPAAVVIAQFFNDNVSFWKSVALQLLNKSDSSPVLS